MGSSRPSPTEFSVLKALWRQSPLSVREVHDAISQELSWSYSSTRKTLERMEEKQLATSRPLHGVRVYEPKAKKVRTLAEHIADFCKRVLELEEPLPASMFVDSKLLDEREIAELERLLKKMKK